MRRPRIDAGGARSQPAHPPPPPPPPPRVDASGKPVPIADPNKRRPAAAREVNAPAFGIRYIPATAREQGIRPWGPSRTGLSLPGTTIVCGDSHTACHGGLARLPSGSGTSEVEHVLATQTLLLQQSKPMEGAGRRRSWARHQRQGSDPPHHRADRRGRRIGLCHRISRARCSRP